MVVVSSTSTWSGTLGCQAFGFRGLGVAVPPLLHVEATLRRGVCGALSWGPSAPLFEQSRFNLNGSDVRLWDTVHFQARFSVPNKTVEFSFRRTRGSKKVALERHGEPCQRH